MDNCIQCRRRRLFIALLLIFIVWPILISELGEYLFSNTDFKKLQGLAGSHFVLRPNVRDLRASTTPHIPATSVDVSGTSTGEYSPLYSLSLENSQGIAIVGDTGSMMFHHGITPFFSTNSYGFGGGGSGGSAGGTGINGATPSGSIASGTSLGGADISTSTNPDASDGSGTNASTNSGSGPRDIAAAPFLIDALFDGEDGKYIALFNPNTYGVPADSHFLKFRDSEGIESPPYILSGILGAASSSVFVVPRTFSHAYLYKGTTTSAAGIKNLPYIVDHIFCDDCGKVSFVKRCPLIAARHYFNRIKK